MFPTSSVDQGVTWRGVDDAAGNVFVADLSNNAVKEILAPGYTVINTIGSGFNHPAGIALMPTATSTPPTTSTRQ